MSVCRVSVGCRRLTHRDHVSGDPSLDILLRFGIRLLFRKDNALMHPHPALMPLEHVSKMEFVPDSTETVLTAF